VDSVTYCPILRNHVKEQLWSGRVVPNTLDPTPLLLEMNTKGREKGGEESGFKRREENSNGGVAGENSRRSVFKSRTRTNAAAPLFYFRINK